LLRTLLLNSLCPQMIVDQLYNVDTVNKVNYVTEDSFNENK